MRINEIINISSVMGYMAGVYDDWTGNVISGETTRSLDPEAIHVIRTIHASTHPETASDMESLDDQAFLTAVGLFKRGSVTNAAALLLGKQSEKLVPPSVCIRWRLLDVDGRQVDSRVFHGPMILGARSVSSMIRNPSVRIVQGGVSKQVSSYRVASLNEALLNAIQHQDYESGGTVDVVEVDGESVTILNRGRFPDVDPERYALGTTHLRGSSNPFLRKALNNIGAVPSNLSGIRGLYLSQIFRHHPLPVYRLEDDRVSVTFKGIRSGDLVRLMDIRDDLDVPTILSLNKISQGRYLSDRSVSELMDLGLVVVDDGVPHIRLDQNSSFDHGSDRDAVMGLVRSNGSVSRSDVMNLLRSRDRKGLDDNRLSVKATNLLQSLRREGLLRKTDGSTKSARYESVESKE